MDYGFTHEGTVYTPNAMPVESAESEARNQDIERIVLAKWATKPDRELVYYHVPRVPHTDPRGASRTFRTTGTVETWMGAYLGTILEARVYPHNFGGRMISMRVRGSNGALYYGRASFDGGDCIWLRRMKD